MNEDNNITGCVLRTLNDFSHFMINKTEVWGSNICIYLGLCLFPEFEPSVLPSAPGYVCGQRFCLFSRFGVCVPPNLPWAAQTRLFLWLCQWGRRRRAEMLAGQTIRISWHISQRKQSNDTESGWPHDWLSIHVFISLSSPADKCFKRLTVLRNDLILWWMCHTVPPIWTWCKDRTGLFMIMMQTANDTKNCCVSLCDP